MSPGEWAKRLVRAAIAGTVVGLALVWVLGRAPDGADLPVAFVAVAAIAVVVALRRGRGRGGRR